MYKRQRLDLMDEYVYFFRKNFDDSIDKYMNDNFVVGIDTANGATYQVAEKVFKDVYKRQVLLVITKDELVIEEFNSMRNRLGRGVN